MSQAQQIKEATDIVEIIGERLQLQRTGSNYRAVCPFHSEKSPSFFVNEQLQRYKCFGCSANGDVIEFLIQYEGLSFPEALKSLADRAGIVLQEAQHSAADDEKTRLLEVLNLAKEYYHYILMEHAAGQPAREYLKQRHISQESIRLFQLGFSLPSWDGLIRYLHKKKKYAMVDLERAGMVISGQHGNPYDRFRERLMFPLKNHRGQVVGFSGRVLESSVKEAKYINSPETMLYHKSELLYGFSELFNEIKKKQTVLVVEGEIDVISSSQAHVNNVVAIKGSALSEHQVRLLTRAAKTIVLALDPDSAGVEATRRAIEICRPFPVELRVLDVASSLEQLRTLDGSARSDLSAKQDPDELARNNPSVWRSVSDSSVSVFEFLLQVALRAHDAATPEGKREIITDLAQPFTSIELSVERDFYFSKLAEALQVRASAVQNDMQLVLGKRKPRKQADTNSTGTDQQQKTPEVARIEQLERYALHLLFSSDADVFARRLADAKDLNFKTIQAAHLFVKLQEVEKIDSLSTFIRQLAPDLQQAIMDWQLDPQFAATEDVIDTDKEWIAILLQLRKEQKKQSISALNEKIQQLDALQERTATQENELAEMLQQLVLLQKQ